MCLTSVIIDNFYVAGVSVRPYETQSVLQIDPDRMLTLAVAGQRLKRITHSSQVAQGFRGMEHDQFSESRALDSGELPAVLFREDLFGFRTAERNDHVTSV